MPAINKKKAAKAVSLKKSQKTATGPKKPKPKLISSQVSIV